LARQRLDTRQAAAILGITPNAVRKRASRGQLESEKGQDDKLYLWLDTGTPPTGQDDRGRLIEFLRHELEVWQDEARRKDHIIAALTERIPAIEAPGEASESPVTASEGAGKGDDGAPEPQKPSEGSWLRRFFGL
jgi:hypothetical protein